VAIAFLDLDRFKWVNDTWGHGAGDHLLQVVAQRLSSSVRACDTVGRFGGDEFALLLASVSSVDEVRAVVDRVLKSLGGAVSVSAEMIHPTASIGLALFPEHGQSAEVLLARADEAMYRAKQAGGGRHAVSGYPPS
jgi:diguanylate cyclase (GGDEF)-like protein